MNYKGGKKKKLQIDFDEQFVKENLKETVAKYCLIIHREPSVMPSFSKKFCFKILRYIGTTTLTKQNQF
jgi:hypothetical protein